MKDTPSFFFSEELSEGNVAQFKAFCTNNRSAAEIIIYINAQSGGKIGFYKEIESCILELQKSGTKVSTIGKLFVSSFLKIFLLGDERIIVLESVGIIHLPVFVSNYIIIPAIDHKRLSDLRDQMAGFISSKTSLTKPQVHALDGQRITAKRLITLGIATKQITKFEPIST